MTQRRIVLALALLVGLVGSALPVLAQPADQATYSYAPAGNSGAAESQQAGPPAAASQTITHSQAFNIVSLNSVACPIDNDRYLRTFDLASFGIDDNFEISSVDIGIETSTPMPLTINLYTLDGAFVFANLTLIGTTTTNIGTHTVEIINIPVSGTAPAGSILVVEVVANDFTEGSTFFIGSNPAGETAPSYLSSVGCNVPEPATTAAVGFSNMQIVMSVHGDPVVDPVVIEDVCVSYYTGAVTVPRGSNGCPAGTMPMTLPGPQSTTLCINGYTGAISWASRGTCTGYGAMAHVVPDDGPLFVCWSTWTGKLRVARTNQSCTPAEVYGVIAQPV